MGNCDPYSDSPEPAVVDKPQSTRVEEPTLLCNQLAKPQLNGTFFGVTEGSLILLEVSGFRFGAFSIR